MDLPWEFNLQGETVGPKSPGPCLEKKHIILYYYTIQIEKGQAAAANISILSDINLPLSFFDFFFLADPLAWLGSGVLNRGEPA